jgi:hypothetical protein
VIKYNVGDSYDTERGEVRWKDLLRGINFFFRSKCYSWVDNIVNLSEDDIGVGLLNLGLYTTCSFNQSINQSINQSDISFVSFHFRA